MWNDRSQKALAATDEEEPWYGLRGRQLFGGAGSVHQDWAQTLLVCNGIIAFDAVLCTGPRHLNSPAWGELDVDALNDASSSASRGVPHWNVAHFSVGGCAGCGSAPEGWTVWGEDNAPRPDADGRRCSEPTSTNPDIGRFPLLPPPPLHSSSIKAAMCPAGQSVNTRRAAAGDPQTGRARFIARCGACLCDRYCISCHRWWCESCYIGPLAASSPGSQGVEPSNTNTSSGKVGEPQPKVIAGICFSPGGCDWRYILWHNVYR